MSYVSRTNKLVERNVPTTMGDTGSSIGQAVGAALNYFTGTKAAQQQADLNAAVAAQQAQATGGIDTSTLLIGAVLLGGGYLVYKKMKKK